ncbi:acid resistance periplasmic serine protease MarP, partial [Mycobacterium sp. ITM-2017-0098]
GELAGVVLGRAVRGAIRNPGLRVADSVVGVALQLVLVLTASWLLGTALMSSPQPNLAAAVTGSRVIAEVDTVAPSWLRSVPDRLSALWETAGLHDVLKPFGPTQVAEIEAPDPTLATSVVVGTTRPSVVKVRGVAQSCQKVLEGTGFVVAPNRVMSNAHVV